MAVIIEENFINVISDDSHLKRVERDSNGKIIKVSKADKEV